MGFLNYGAFQKGYLMLALRKLQSIRTSPLMKNVCEIQRFLLIPNCFGWFMDRFKMNLAPNSGFKNHFGSMIPCSLLIFTTCRDFPIICCRDAPFMASAYQSKAEEKRRRAERRREELNREAKERIAEGEGIFIIKTCS